LSPRKHETIEDLTIQAFQDFRITESIAGECAPSCLALPGFVRGDECRHGFGDLLTNLRWVQPPTSLKAAELD
jgi:hypothetical protein